MSHLQRKIMDLLYEMDEESADDNRAHLPSVPNNSVVRTTLRIMEERVPMIKKVKKPRYVYPLSGNQGEARLSAIEYLLRRLYFFS